MLISDCNLFLSQKLANTCSFVGGHIIVQHEKISRAERSWKNPVNALQEAIHFPFIIFCTYCLSSGTKGFAICLGSQEIYQHDPNAIHLKFQFLRQKGYLSNTFRTLSLFIGFLRNTPSLISNNNFDKKGFVCIGHHDNDLA